MDPLALCLPLGAARCLFPVVLTWEPTTSRHTLAACSRRLLMRCLSLLCWAYSFPQCRLTLSQRGNPAALPTVSVTPALSCGRTSFSPSLAAGQLGVAGRQGAAEVHLGALEPASQLHPGGHGQRHRHPRLGHAEHEVSDTPGASACRPPPRGRPQQMGVGHVACLSASRFVSSHRELVCRGRGRGGSAGCSGLRGGPSALAVDELEMGSCPQGGDHEGQSGPWWRVSCHRLCAVGDRLSSPS